VKLLRIAKYGLLGLCTGAMSGAVLGYLNVREARSGFFLLSDRAWRELIITISAVQMGVVGLLVGLALGVVLVIVAIIHSRRPSPFA